MVRVLNVAEKNDAAKNLAGLLSRGHSQRKEGRSKFNKIYEFEYNLFNQRVMMAMTSVSGHLLATEFVGNCKNWAATNPVTLFDAPVMKYCPDNFADIKRTLEEETRKSQYLIIWTDCDREGENIGFEVISVCRAIKQNLTVYRAKFSEITYQSVVRAINNLCEPNQNVSDAVEVRQELDLRIGAAFTRFQTLRLRQVFPETLSDSLISYGSCQFPTLGFVVERYRSIAEFVQEPFWKIKVVWQPNEEERVDFLWKRNHLFSQLVTQVLLERCLEQPTATVSKAETKPKSKWRPVPLDTVELEKLVSRKLRINAKETMTIAEKLYTQGLISYPRTETNIFPKELDLKPLVEMQVGDPSWGAFAQRVLDEGINPRQGKKSDQAHPPIHPTKYAAQLNNPNEKKIYEFIVRHFLACVSSDAQGFETVAEVDINQEKFVASGLQIVARNYLEVYPYDKWSDKSIPRFAQGDTFQPTSITMEEGKTSPPQLLSEADLIALMEKHGIGTDATHADHIDTIKKREYVGVQHDGRFLPHSLGMGLVRGYDAMGIALSKPNLRAELESELQQICDGLMNPQDVLKRQIDKYRAAFVQAMSQVTKIDDALSEYFTEEKKDAVPFPSESSSAFVKYRQCPQCNMDMVLKRKKDNQGFYFSCVAYPQCKVAIWLPSTVVAVEVDPATCSSCSSRPHLLRFRFAAGSYTPIYPDNYIGCIGGCNRDFNELLGIRNVSAANCSVVSNANRSTTAPPSINESGYFSNSSQNASGASFNNNSRTSSSSGQSNGSQVSRSSFSNTSRASSSGYGSILSSSGQGNGPLPSAGRPATRLPSKPTTSEGKTTTVCNCNADAALRTVRKEGPNTGRQFYCCAKGQNECGFFLWADAATESGTDPAPFTSNRQPTAAFRSADPVAGSSDVRCACGEPAKSLTVQKPGPTQGRPFYACAKPRESQCNFFQWADQDATGPTNYAANNAMAAPPSRAGASRGGRGGASRAGASRGRATSKTTTDGPPKKRKCGQCGQEGHTRQRCPMNSE